MEKSLFNELTLEQKQKLLTLPAELKHFTQTQWAAIYGIVPMTQELFDSIQSVSYTHLTLPTIA